MTWHTDKIPNYDIPPISASVKADGLFCQLDQVNELYCHNVLIADANQMTFDADKQSLLIQWDENRFSQCTDFWTMEQFAGGFGGWSFARRYLESQGTPLHKTIAIESYLPYATQHALSHGFCLIGDPVNMPDDFLLRNDQSAVIVTRIQDMEWKKQLQFLPISLWTISAPCQSWSLAASQEGFGSPDGIALAEAIGHIRIFKPPVVAIEQVAGFEQHTQHGLALRLLEWAGYQLISKGTYDLADIMPTKRNRWIATFVHSEFRAQLNPMQLCTYPWPNLPMTLRTADAVWHLNSTECAEFEPTVAEASMYFDCNFMPGRHKCWTKKRILDYRIPTVDQKLPTFLARYGQQHKLRPYQLSNRGLFGHFIRQGTSFRFWTPVEIALLHGQVHSTIILKPKFLGLETMGNSISVPHALFGLCISMNLLHNSGLNPTNMVLNFLIDRLTMTNAVISQDYFAWYLAKPEHQSEMKQRLHFFMNQMHWTAEATTNVWPSGAFFSPSDGILPMNDTATMEPDFDQPQHQKNDDIQVISDSETPAMTFQFALALIPGEYGILHVDSSVHLHQLIQMWNQIIAPKQTWQTDELSKPISELDIPHREMLFPVTDEATVAQLQHAMDALPISKMVPIMHRTSTDLTLYEIAEGTTWKQLKSSHPQFAKVRHDIFGMLTDQHSFRIPAEISDDPYPALEPDITETQLMQLANVKFETFVPTNTDILVMHCKGDAQSRSAFLAFLTPDDMVC